MTTLKKNTLAVALVAAMGFAANASAFDLTTGGDTDPVMVATFDIASASTQIGVNEDFSVSLNSNDLILGRTSGFTIRIDLSNGAEFATAAAVANGTALPAGWTSTLVSGGAAGDTFVIVKFDPPSSSPVPGLVEGELFKLTAADAQLSPATGDILTNLVALQTAGQKVDATVQFRDPTTAQPIMAAQSLTLLQSGDPTVLTCDPENGWTYARIDVGTNNGSYDSKTTFSYYGGINDGGNYYFDAGTVDVSIASGFSSFSYTSTDEFTTTLTGTAFSAFADGDIFLTTSGYCDGPSNQVPGTISADGTTVTFDYTGADVGVGSSSSGFSLTLCFYNGDTDVIDATPVTVQTTFTRGSHDSNGSNCSLLPLLYNGSVVKVATFNPGGNTTQQSFLRVTNPSAIPGLVTIDGTDDSGAAGASPVTFTLAAGQSVQINSDVLENGGTGYTGSLGNGTGKWRLVVTGEFAGMRVASLNRNTVSGTVTNLTDYDTAQEQNTPNNCGWSGGNSCYTGSDSY